jgi:glycerol-3-phosphate dehydrogenase
MIRIGLFLYDHLGSLFGGASKLPKSGFLKLKANSPLFDHYKYGFTYYDCSVDDARLVISNALDAQEKNAQINTQTKFIKAQRHHDHWIVTYEKDGKEFDIATKVLVNAAGPWVSDIIEDRLTIKTHNRLRLIQGSHIITPRFFKEDNAYILQLKDGRIIFAIPYQDDLCLIGTTEVKFDIDPSDAIISEDEIQYLCDQINGYFKPQIKEGRKLMPCDVVSHFSGVRPLYDDASAEASAVTRDYVLALRADDQDDDGQILAPLLSVFGGKVTTSRHLANSAMEKLAAYLPDMGMSWTKDAKFPGGDIPHEDPEAYYMALCCNYPYLPQELIKNYVYRYGTRTILLLKNVKNLKDLGTEIGPELYEKEIRFLKDTEWAINAEDILWRRTKLGLKWSDKSVAKLEEYLKPTG